MLSRLKQVLHHLPEQGSGLVFSCQSLGQLDASTDRKSRLMILTRSSSAPLTMAPPAHASSSSTAKETRLPTTRLNSNNIILVQAGMSMIQTSWLLLSQPA
jgi:hypothetical protein